MHVYLPKHQSAAAVPGMLQINAEVHWVTQEETKCRGQVLQADDEQVQLKSGFAVPVLGSDSPSSTDLMRALVSSYTCS